MDVAFMFTVYLQSISNFNSLPRCSFTIFRKRKFHSFHCSKSWSYPRYCYFFCSTIYQQSLLASLLHTQSNHFLPPVFSIVLPVLLNSGESASHLSMFTFFPLHIEIGVILSKYIQLHHSFAQNSQMGSYLY